MQYAQRKQELYEVLIVTEDHAANLNTLLEWSKAGELGLQFTVEGGCDILAVVINGTRFQLGEGDVVLRYADRSKIMRCAALHRVVFDDGYDLIDGPEDFDEDESVPTVAEETSTEEERLALVQEIEAFAEGARRNMHPTQEYFEFILDSIEDYRTKAYALWPLPPGEVLAQFDKLALWVKQNRD